MQIVYHVRRQIVNFPISSFVAMRLRIVAAILAQATSSSKITLTAYCATVRVVGKETTMHVVRTHTIVRFSNVPREQYSKSKLGKHFVQDELVWRQIMHRVATLWPRAIATFARRVSRTCPTHLAFFVRRRRVRVQTTGLAARWLVAASPSALAARMRRPSLAAWKRTRIRAGRHAA